jgi:hypothetical protein
VLIRERQADDFELLFLDDSPQTARGVLLLARPQAVTLDETQRVTPSESCCKIQNRIRIGRHCEERSDEAIHPFFRGARWIASLSLSPGAHSRGPLARNDEEK